MVGKLPWKHDRRQYWILIVAWAAYMCSHSYLFATTATVAFEVLIELAFIGVSGMVGWRARWGVGAWDVFFLREGGSAVMIVAGCTVNAMTSAVFDLSFLYGLQWLYFVIVVFSFLYIRVLDNMTAHAMYTDYWFGVMAIGALALTMNFVVYGEPYTFIAAIVYILSVVLLVATSAWIRWWALLAFFLVWVVALIVGYLVNVYLEKDYIRPVSYYFSQTPLL